MLKSIKTLCLTAAVALLSACGWHFDNGALVPEALKTLTFESGDPYGEMSMALRRQLQLNNVNLVPAAQNVPVLRLARETTSNEVASIFQRGREAEKVLILNVDANVRLANGQTYPISTKVSRTFFDNSRAALAKSAERDVIWNDMRNQAARQLISKMASLQTQVQGAK